MNNKQEEDAWSAFRRAYELFEAGKLSVARVAYEKAASLGSIPALVNLANYYDDGAFGRHNRKRALVLYKKAVSLGSPEAAYALACLYRGEHKQRWQEHWLKRAAALGDTDAPRELKELQK
jgi:TPR repeat protein